MNKVFSQIILGSALLIATTTIVFAGQSAYIPFQGLYMGVGAAENQYSFESKYQFNPAVLAGVNNQQSFNKSNLNPAVTFGYGGLLYCDYLFGAVETNASFNAIQRTQGNVANTTNEYIFNNSYNLLAKLGYVFQDINLGYVLAGVSKTSLKREVVFSSSFFPITLLPLDQTQNIFGPIFGIGYERAYDQYLHFAIEYNHINYSRTNYTLQSGAGINKVYLSQDTLLLKAIYYL